MPAHLTPILREIKGDRPRTCRSRTPNLSLVLRVRIRARSWTKSARENLAGSGHDKVPGTENAAKISGQPLHAPHGVVPEADEGSGRIRMRPGSTTEKCPTQSVRL